MPQVSRTQRLKSEICKFIPKYAYKDGIRVSDERYKELMLCRFRPEYTQIEVREAIDYLWSSGQVPVTQVVPSKAPVVSEQSLKAKKEELAAIAQAAIAQAAEERKRAAQAAEANWAVKTPQATSQVASNNTSKNTMAPNPGPTVKTPSATKQHRNAIADMESSWGGSSDATSFVADGEWVAAHTTQHNGTDWAMPEAPRMATFRSKWASRPPKTASPPENHPIPAETSNGIFTAARNGNVDKLVRADNPVPFEPEPAFPVPGIPSLDDQIALLSLDTSEAESTGLAKDDIKSSILLSADTLTSNLPLIPQYALIGADLEPTRNASDPRLFVNTNHPFSAFICGLQGSGKSHSTSCLIENCLIESRSLGSLRKPLAALVFHYSEYTSREAFRPCEAAFIAHPDPAFKNIHRNVPATVLVPPSNFRSLQQSYEQIPGVTVKALLLRPRDLNISSLLTLMSVDKSESVPLYLAQITKILRDMAMRNPVFDYHEFKREVGRLILSPQQKQPLQLRLDLLESFLDLSGDETNTGFCFDSGAITIVDLSCPFVDSGTACVLFNIVLGMFLAKGDIAGKVIAVDEAHKYITKTPASKVFTEALISAIRQQRHYGARIIIATQEPTIDPRLMDLCSMTLIHRFTSPEWFNVLKRHVSVHTDDEGDMMLFNRINGLRIGEALMFAPSAVVGGGKLGGDALKLKVRKRVTWDGGKSIVSV